MKTKAKAKYVDINGQPVVTHKYAIEVTITAIVFVESTNIEAAEIEAINNNYTVMSEGLKEPEPVHVADVTISYVFK